MKHITVLLLLLILCLFPRPLAAQEESSAPGVQSEIPLESAENIPEDENFSDNEAISDDENISQQELAAIQDAGEMVPLADRRGIIEKFEDDISEDAKMRSFGQRIIIAAAILFGLILLLCLIWYGFKRINKKITETHEIKIKPLTIKKLKILSARQIVYIIQLLLRISKYIISIFLFFITIPIVFSLFQVTKHIASTLFNYILSPLKNILFGIIQYIPNLITIIIIIIVMRYVLRALKFFSKQITNDKLVIPGFYAEWAEPTYKILQVLLWAFTLAIVYPYLPGANSRIFQGVSVFIGIIFSFSSTTAIGNLVAGLVITYMRPFKIGDRVQIKEITGFVVEKNLMVVRIKTHKNEYVTFPNMMILQGGIINYNTSSDEDEEGLIIHAELTYGYATPWQTIHEILINAALATNHVQKRPHPYVLQTGLDDFYARYQINCYTKHVDKVPSIYTELYENIQNGFREANMDPTTAHFQVIDDRRKNRGRAVESNK